MIESFTALTQEVDDVDVAVSEILAQLDFGGKNKLLKNTIGIISCFADYIESGVWEALAKALPFEILGTTTISNASNGAIGETMLTLMVLTSDDVSFSTALSEPITEESAEPLKALYEDAFAKLPKNPDFSSPSLMFSFAPLFSKISNGFYAASMTKISGNVPNFGAVTVDHNSDYHMSYVLFNGKYYKDRFAIILLYGNVSPSFHVGNISDEKVFPGKGVVNSSEDNLIKIINGKPAIEYLLSIGLSKNENGEIIGINAFPILVDYNDGTPLNGNSMLAVTPDGSVVSGDKIPEGATINIGAWNTEELVNTSGSTLRQALSQKNHHTVLIYCCIGRYFALGYESTKELEQIQKQMEGTGSSYIAAYVGGELCPVYGKDGKTVNRNHGNSIVICTF
jgi:hypothetical protein